MTEVKSWAVVDAGLRKRSRVACPKRDMVSEKVIGIVDNIALRMMKV